MGNARARGTYEARKAQAITAKRVKMANQSLVPVLVPDVLSFLRSQRHFTQTDRQARRARKRAFARWRKLHPGKKRTQAQTAKILAGKS